MVSLLLCLAGVSELTSWLDQIHVNNEPWLHRVMSHSVSGQDNSFRNGIRARDGKCVISGVKHMSAAGNWTSFEAAHIFPLELENLWIEFNYGRWVDDGMDHNAGISGINSCQNGFLIQSTAHGLFDQYLLSMNPDVHISTILIEYLY